MKLAAKETNKLSKLMNAFANSNNEMGNVIIDYERSEYYNLRDSLYELPEIKKVYDEDILMNQIVHYINRTYKKYPIHILPEHIDEILSKAIEILQREINDHLIILPIKILKLNDVVSFDIFTFIPSHFSKRRKQNIIAKLIKKSRPDLAETFEHTEISRSKLFFRYNLLCIKIKEHTNYTHFNSTNIVKTVLYSLRCYYYSMVWKINSPELNFNSIQIEKMPKPSHIAIYSKDIWRQIHKPIFFDGDCNFDATWLTDIKHQKKFTKFVNVIYFKKDSNDLQNRFLNALWLFNDAINQSKSISTLLFMTVAESLLLRERNEKRLRIAAVLPMLVKIENVSSRKLAEVLDSTYHARNNFIHSGEYIIYTYKEIKEKLDTLQLTRAALATLIFQLPKYIVALSSQKAGSPSVNDWDNYVNNLFKKKVMG